MAGAEKGRGGKGEKKRESPSPFSLLSCCHAITAITPVWCHLGSSQSIKIGTDLSIDESIKIGKSDLIDIDCMDQLVEIDDTLVSFIDLS